MRVRYIVTVDFEAFDQTTGNDVPLTTDPDQLKEMKEMMKQELRDASIDFCPDGFDVCVASSCPNDVQEVEE